MKTALSGPFIVYGDRNPPGTAATGTVNSDKAPSMFWGGTSIMDPRVGYNVTRAGTIGWLGVGDMVVIDQVPSTLTTTNIAAAALAVAGTPITLVSSTGAGITVLSAATQVWASGNTIPAAACAIDSSPGLVTFGLASVASGNTAISVYDPTKSIARNVRVTSNGGNDTGATFTVAGYDIYGYAMSEVITGASSATASGAKAFKFVTSVTPAGTINSTTVSVGTGDVFGFPILCNTQGYTNIFWNSAFVTAATGFTAAVTTTATTTSGDVRGTYALQAASNNALRLQVFISIAPANIGTTTGLFGVTQA